MCYEEHMTTHEHILIVGGDPALVAEIEAAAHQQPQTIQIIDTISSALTAGQDKPVDLVVFDEVKFILGGEKYAAIGNNLVFLVAPDGVQSSKSGHF